MTNSFQNIFGGITIYPSDLGFIDYTMTQSASFVWPTLGESSSHVAASFTRITASGAGIVATLPDADAASVGNALRFKNNGSTAYTIKSASGSIIATMSAGQDILLSITDNTTSGGAWDSSYIGSGTTSANAADLAGAGLTVSGSHLDVNWPVDYTGSSGFQLTNTSLGRVLSWTGGTGSIEIAVDGGTITNGFITAIKNNGTGALTVSGTFIDGIDGVVGSTVSLYPNDSTFIVGAGASKGYYTIGLTNNTSVTGTLQIDVSSQSSITLTAGQMNNRIFILTGTVDDNGCTIVFPEVSGNFLIINQTMTNSVPRASMGYATIQTSASGGTSVRIPFNETRSVVSDGTNIYFADNLSPREPAQNLLYFADFSKNPWQRGTSFTSSSVIQYGPDRISFVCASGAGFQITRQTSTNSGCLYDMRIQRTSGAPAASGTQLFIGMDLTLQESLPLRYKNPTLAIDVSPGSGGSISLPSIGIYTSNGSNNKVLSAIGSGWSIPALISAPIITAGSGSYYRFLVNPSAYTGNTSVGGTFSQVSVLAQINLTGTGASDYINISRIGLVDGNFDEFDNPDPIAVQQKCQQFAYVIQPEANGQPIATGQAFAANGAATIVNFPSTMRQTPTLTITAATDFNLLTSTATLASCSSIALGTGGNKTIAQLSVVTTSALLTAGAATILFASGITGKIIFSADL